MLAAQRKSSKIAKKPTVKEKESPSCVNRHETDAVTASPPAESFVKRFLRRMFILVLAVVLAYLVSNRNSTHLEFANSDRIPRRSHQVPCSKDYENTVQFNSDCAPKRCGRVVMDNLIAKEDAEKLLNLAMKTTGLSKPNGGVSIFDMNSGALTMGDAFINIFKMPAANGLFTAEDFHVFRKVKNAILLRLSMEFGPLPHKLFLTSPTFFSRMTIKPAKTIHDEYWHPHVDKETYKTFDYTSLVYLGTYNKDFTGGRFVFVDKDANRTVEPAEGRVSMFTSGSENLHHVERVTSGERFALTVSFTCSQKFAIPDPSLNSIQDSKHSDGKAPYNGEHL